MFTHTTDAETFVAEAAALVARVQNRINAMPNCWISPEYTRRGGMEMLLSERMFDILAWAEDRLERRRELLAAQLQAEYDAQPY